MNDLASLLHRTCQIMDESRWNVLRPLGLTPRQYLLLQCYASGDGMSQTDAVEATGVDRSTSADISRRLFKSGFIERKRTCRDARMYEVRVSSHGRSVLAKAEPKIRAADAAVLAGLSDVEQTRLLLMLGKIKPDSTEDREAA